MSKNVGPAKFCVSLYGIACVRVAKIVKVATEARLLVKNVVAIVSAESKERLKLDVNNRKGASSQ